MKKEQSSFLSSMQSSLQEIKSQYTKLQESVDFTSTKYDEVINKMLQYEAERKETNTYIKKLEDRVDQLEKLAKNTCLEIKNIPKNSNETKMDLVNVVLSISKALDASIAQTEIKDVFRIHSSTAMNNTIIVDLTTVVKKEIILQAVRTYNKANRDNKLNTCHLHINGPKPPVYISDNLTMKTRKLFFLSGEFAALHHFKHCWTAHGKVYIRKEDGAKRYCINCEGDFSKIPEI
ncbi:uncharacterized protein LOC113507375 [Trichoplusia ni]|uniref:Uncharacterized protein LOC113507375 n=1 Tax=Trichoplusia ni TaxID=7111 RepID=A0A7E5X0U4_TRINI|nr:uncharacterized protein LOC113507375 [Trichoplusia ni]